MKSRKYVAILTLLNALTFCLTTSSQSAQGSKGANTKRGEGSHMSSKGQENTNAQWSGDPERGRARAEERHELRDQRRSEEEPEPNRGKHKGNSSKGKTTNNLLRDY